MNIGDYIREKREELNIGQRAFAKIAGMSHSYLSEIENGKAKSNPTDEVMQKIADTGSIVTGKQIGRAHV